MELIHKTHFIKVYKDDTVIRRGVPITHANRVGKVIERSTACDSEHEYTIVRVQWRDYAENYTESRKPHSKEKKKILAQI